MTPQSGNVAGILLAAGDGSRLGQPKALVVVGGQSLARPLSVVVHDDVDPFGDLETTRIAPKLVKLLPYDRYLFGEGGCRRGPSTEKAVAVTDTAAQRGGCTAAEPERRVGLLERLGLHGCAIKLPESSLDGDLGFGPQQLHQP